MTRFAGSRPTRYTRLMRFDVRLVLPFAFLVPCLSLACVERQEQAPQQQAPTPSPEPQATEAAKPKFNPQGIPIKKGMGVQGMGIGQGPTASPPPPPPGSSAQNAPSASASK